MDNLIAPFSASLLLLLPPTICSPEWIFKNIRTHLSPLPDLPTLRTKPLGSVCRAPGIWLLGSLSGPLLCSGPQPSCPPWQGVPFLPFGIQLGFCVRPLSPLVFSLPMTLKAESRAALTEHWTQAPCVSWTAVSPWGSHRHSNSASQAAFAFP